jgi:CubicO group peptidase (beta-lactamase class C family)
VIGNAIEQYLGPDEELACGLIGAGSLDVLYRSPGSDVYPWASVSKLVAALAVHVALEDGTLQRTSRVGDFELSVEDLLSHSSGLATGEVGEPRLLAPEHVEPSRPPHERRIYSNIGYELLGRSLEGLSGIRYRDYAMEAVLQPAGMTGASFVVPSSVGDGVTAEGVTGAAFGLQGKLDDLIGLVAALCFEVAVSLESLVAIRTVFLPDLSGILPGFGHQSPNPWGLGAEVRGHKSPHWMGTMVSAESFGHFGQSGSFLWIDPIQQCFAVFAGSKPFGAWAKERWPSLNDAIVHELRS